MNSWSFRSAAVPCSNRGYHASGANTVRPSLRSTTNASSLTRTDVALISICLVAKEFNATSATVVFEVDQLPTARTTQPLPQPACQAHPPDTLCRQVGKGYRQCEGSRPSAT